jgi:RES domain-containing protein
MTIRAWRIVKPKHAAAAFTGEGARKYGGRWNSPGRAVVYVSATASLAVLETLVHLRSRELTQRYVLLEVQFDSEMVEAVDPEDLPQAWRSADPPTEAQRFGDEWLAKASSAILRVPSVIVPAEWNYLLNPAHPDFGRIVIGPRVSVRLDPRLRGA